MAINLGSSRPATFRQRSWAPLPCKISSLALTHGNYPDKDAVLLLYSGHISHESPT